ncbi:type II toxin-antitoxin system PemK/MazF family toxin [Laspinema olomoucense]|uniref:type II toxin-antitoxin system PemK/MazF family toxin n=1 Tax=Laspinema olomoucense TaxID=3231600 RepID=UPI0021BAB26B|nr:type II toxin-antitoxin system PemK/MazF family toxin [Laspinema sp. D3c]MCT7995571.1 type II toxin-antitoxin system PemK/MazF family toxin [Laspinema sp. D3c]
MTNPIKWGEVWLANLNPTQGSEQAGIRPVIIFQNDIVSQFSTTTLEGMIIQNSRILLPISVREEVAPPS